MDFSVFHEYRRLAHMGAVEALKCPDDGDELITMLGFNDEPALLCFSCGGITTPGTRMYEELQAAVAAYHQHK